MSDAKYQIGEVAEFIEEKRQWATWSEEKRTLVIDSDVGTSFPPYEITQIEKVDDKWMYELWRPEHHLSWPSKRDVPERRFWAPESWIRKLEPITIEQLQDARNKK